MGKGEAVAGSGGVFIGLDAVAEEFGDGWLVDEMASPSEGAFSGFVSTVEVVGVIGVCKGSVSDGAFSCLVGLFRVSGDGVAADDGVAGRTPLSGCESPLSGFCSFNGASFTGKAIFAFILAIALSTLSGRYCQIASLVF
jgi:hypothetical protein